MARADFYDLLEDLAQATGQAVCYANAARTRASLRCPNPAALPCAGCAWRAGAEVCPSLLAPAPEDGLSHCRGGFARLTAEIGAGGHAFGTLSVGPMLPPDQARLRGLRTLLRAFVCLVRTDRLFPGRDGLFAELNEYVLAHIADPLSAEDLAAAFFVSADTLSRLTRRETGLPLRRYIQARRLELARTLLLGTSLSVQEIAGQCGVSDFNYFSRLFRRHYGCTPTQLRAADAEGVR